MKVGLDIDDIAADFEGNLIKAVNFTLGTNFKRGELTPDPSYWVKVMGSEEEAEKIWQIFRGNLEFDASLELVEGAAEGVRDLYEAGHELYWVTNRVKDNKAFTMAWSQRRLGEVILDIFYTSASGRNGRPSKGEVCVRERMKLLVDDVSKNIWSAVEQGIDSVVLDKVWNQDLPEHPLIKRVYSWKEIPPYVNELKERKGYK